MIEGVLQKQINNIMEQARQSRLEFVTVEHLLLALLNVGKVIDFLNSKNIDISRLRLELKEYINLHTPIVSDNSDFNITPTVGFQRVLQRSVYQVQLAQKKTVDALNVLVSIFSEKESYAVILLKNNNLSSSDITEISEIEENNIKQNSASKNTNEKRKKTSLEKYAVNLCTEARKGSIDSLLGREEELARTFQILSRRRKNNPLFVGKAGVGKTAIAQGIAKKIIDGNVPDILKDAVIYSLDIGVLIAGTKYRGDFEDRIKSILKDLKKAKNTILFIDEIHTLIGAGGVANGSLDASNLLKPALANGNLKCIGSTTYDEYRKIFEKDHALSRRFQKIDIEEPSINDAVKILNGLKKYYQKHHKVKYSPAAIVSAVELSNRYITDRYLPDKAIDVIDEAGALQQIKPKSKRKINIKTNDIEDIVAKFARIPSKQISDNDKSFLKNLAQELKLNVFGQNLAVDSLSTAIKLSRSGLGPAEKPVGSFLFAGPTGVGKTEICKQLARIMNIKLLRFDMSEYMERHSVSKLIGSPPGYVGYDQGGLLTEAVNSSPYSLLLLDEIEKAHPDIFNILLQVMDNGKLTDANGREVDFRNVILVMTSNVGARNAARSSVGFSKQDYYSDYKKELKQVFTPEFRNRLSEIIYFNALDENTIIFVVDKFLFELENILEAKNISLIVTDTARKWLAKNGYDEDMGARPMARLIEHTIRKPLADELLFNKLTDGGTVKVDVKKNKLKLYISK
jgi:ATP-dependent Clp protease ATP-binding subunit ClpA